MREKVYILDIDMLILLNKSLSMTLYLYIATVLIILFSMLFNQATSRDSCVKAGGGKGSFHFS